MGIFSVLLPFMVGPRNPPSNRQMAGADIPIIAHSTLKTASAQHWGNVASHSPAPAEKDVRGSGALADDSANAENAMYEVNRIAELENLGMTDDPNSLLTIESEFDDRDPRIQEAAVAAAVQFGSRDAIPTLQYAYLQFDDPGQKLNIQNAIRLLELPSVGEASGLSTPPVDASR